MSVQRRRPYSVRLMHFEEGGAIFVVKGPRMPQAGYVATSRAIANEIVARAETHRLCGMTWRASERAGVIHLDRRIGREQVVPFRSWEQAARFLIGWRAAGRPTLQRELARAR